MANNECENWIPVYGSKKDDARCVIVEKLTIITNAIKWNDKKNLQKQQQPWMKL